MLCFFYIACDVSITLAEQTSTIFEKLFCTPGGGGYPKERVVPEQRNKKILDEVKAVTHRDLVTILKELDHELVKGALSEEHFTKHFFADCKDDDIADCVREILK